jgi:bacterioferritin (cytochrome b1)
MKALWNYRFRKLLEAEEEGLRQYDRLIEKCEKALHDPKSLELLRKIRREETTHCRLAEELLEIAQKT